RARFDGAEKSVGELGRVRQDHQHAVFDLDAEILERIAGAVNVLEYFLVGDFLILVINRHFAAAALGDVFIDEGRGGIVDIRQAQIHRKDAEREDRGAGQRFLYPRSSIRGGNLFTADNFALKVGGDDDRLGIGIVLDRFVAVLFPEAALFHAAEGQLVVDDLRRVDPGVAGFDVLRAVHGAVDVARPDRRAQTEDRAVGLLDGLVEAFHAHDRQRRTEDFFLDHA